MKIKIRLIICMILISTLVGCKEKNILNEEVTEESKITDKEIRTKRDVKSENLEVPPDIYVIYDNEKYQGVKGTSSWNVDLGDGRISGIEVDSIAPNELVDYQKQKILLKENVWFKIDFDLEPNSYNIKVWNSLDDTEEVIYNNENGILVPSGRETVIYVVSANWEQGNANYAFEITVDN